MLALRGLRALILAYYSTVGQFRLRDSLKADMPHESRFNEHFVPQEGHSPRKGHNLSLSSVSAKTVTITGIPVILTLAIAGTFGMRNLCRCFMSKFCLISTPRPSGR